MENKKYEFFYILKILKKIIKIINGLADRPANPTGWPDNDPRNWRVGGSKTSTQTRLFSGRVVSGWRVVSEIDTPTKYHQAIFDGFYNNLIFVLE